MMRQPPACPQTHEGTFQSSILLSPRCQCQYSPLLMAPCLAGAHLPQGVIAAPEMITTATFKFLPSVGQTCDSRGESHLCALRVGRATLASGS